MFSFFFFFKSPAPTETYTLSLHDALPISPRDGFEDAVLGAEIVGSNEQGERYANTDWPLRLSFPVLDRKSTRLNSSHTVISYAVFCLKKKNKNKARTSSNDLEQAITITSY